MSKNVQELAEELRIDKNELAAMINGMSLGLMGVTGSTILTPMDVERIKKKLEADRKAQTESKEKSVEQNSGPVRRRSKASSDSGAVAPVRRRRKKVSEPEEEDAVAPVRRRVTVVKDGASTVGVARSKVVAADETKKTDKVAKTTIDPKVEPTADLTEEQKKSSKAKEPVTPTVPHKEASPGEHDQKSASPQEDSKTETTSTVSAKVQTKDEPKTAPSTTKAKIISTPKRQKPPKDDSLKLQERRGGTDPAKEKDSSKEVTAQEPAAPTDSSAPSSHEQTPEKSAPVARQKDEKADKPAAETKSKPSQQDKEKQEKEKKSSARRPARASESRTSYAAKIVHRPVGGRVDKKPKVEDVEPIQQQPRRRTSPAVAEAKRNEDLRTTKETPAPQKTAPPKQAPKRDARAEKETDASESTMVRAKVKSKPAPATPEDTSAAVKTESTTPRRASSRKKAGATIVKKMDKSVVLDRLNAEGKDFTPGPKRQGQRSGRRSSGRRGRKRVVEGTDLYGASSTRKGRKSQKQKKKPQKTKITEAAEHKRVIRVEDAITVGDLAHQMGVKAGQVAMRLLELGMMATINTTIDYETAAIVAEEFNHTVENVAFDISEFYDTEPDSEDTLESRPPVVTVMGHVDHGKTSLLDAIRSSTVAAGEAGGITQHIGAYQVKTDAGVITFLDTPGHEAFTALRARGAQATDITVLVVAADDGVMPQTMEAINHSQAANVPIVVAINKIDKPGANVDRVKQALTEYNLVAEEWGGSTLFVEVSAKERINIDELIETIMLQAEIEELQANPNRDAQGLVIEAQLDVGRGSVATVLVQRGTLKQGDIIVSGQFYGKVRTMNNERGELVSKAYPSQPVEITGLGGVPAAGEPFFVVQEEKDAKRICQNVIDQRRKEKLAARAKDSAVSLEDLSAMIKEGELKELKVILKGDVQGSVEAIKQAFSKLGNDEVGVAVIHSGVGGITENDVNLAASSEKGAVVVGFNVRPDNRAQIMAEKYAVKILTHSIIYDAIEQIRILLEGMLEPIIEEETIGSAEVRDIFSAPKVGTVAGCYVTQGIIKRGAKARVVRDSRVMYDSTIESLRRFKDNVNEVKTGFECGLSVENFNDIKLGDTIECYILKEVAAKL